MEHREVKKRLYDIAFDLKCCRADPVKVMEQYIRIMKLAIKMNEEHNYGLQGIQQQAGRVGTGPLDDK